MGRNKDLTNDNRNIKKDTGNDIRNAALGMITILCLALASSVVLGKGGSSGGFVVTEPAPEKKFSCEDFKTVKERVECRLVNGTTSETLPESCRDRSDSSACTKLYKDVLPCYKLNGKEKDKCFKMHAGFKGISVAAESGRGNKKGIDNYLLFLLYDLEEKVEDAYKDGKISSSNAAELISDITELKKAINDGKPKSEITDSIKMLKLKWDFMLG